MLSKSCSIFNPISTRWLGVIGEHKICICSIIRMGILVSITQMLWSVIHYTQLHISSSSTVFSPSVPWSHANSPILEGRSRFPDTCRCLCTCINQPLSLSNLTSAGEYNQVTHTARKHWQDDNKENEAVLPDSLPPTKKPRTYAERRSNTEKLQDIL